MDRKILFQIYHIMRERRFLPALDQESQHGPWALKKLMQSTHIYRVSGVAGYKRKKYAVCGKGRAELPEPDFACRSFRPVGILLGSAFPKPCFILRLLIGSWFPKSLRASLLTVCISCGFLTEIRVVSCSVCQLPLFTLGHLLVLKKERFSDTI